MQSQIIIITCTLYGKYLTTMRVISDLNKNASCNWEDQDTTRNINGKNFLLQDTVFLDLKWCNYQTREKAHFLYIKYLSKYNFVEMADVAFIFLQRVKEKVQKQRNSQKYYLRVFGQRITKYFLKFLLQIGSGCWSLRSRTRLVFCTRPFHK